MNSGYLSLDCFTGCTHFFQAIITFWLCSSSLYTRPSNKTFISDLGQAVGRRGQKPYGQWLVAAHLFQQYGLNDQVKGQWGTFFFLLIKIVYLFFFLLSHTACRISVHQGLNPGPRQWKHPVLTTRPPGNAPDCIHLTFTGWCFGVRIRCETIATVRLNNVSVTSTASVCWEDVIKPSPLASFKYTRQHCQLSSPCCRLDL